MITMHQAWKPTLVNDMIIHEHVKQSWPRRDKWKSRAAIGFQVQLIDLPVFSLSRKMSEAEFIRTVASILDSEKTPMKVKANNSLEAAEGIGGTGGLLL